MRIPKILAATLSFFSASALTVLAGLPPGSSVEPAQALTEKDGVMLASAAAKVSVPLSGDAACLRILALSGKDKGGISMDIIWDDQSKTSFFAKAGDIDGNAKDAFLTIPGNRRLYIRPNLSFYANQQRKGALVKGWSKMGAASEHLIKIEIRKTAQGAQLWLDSRFYEDYPKKGKASRLEFSLSPGAGIKEIVGSGEAPGKFLTLGLEDFARPATWAEIMGKMGWVNVMESGNLSIPAGAGTFEGVPLRVSPANRNIDVAGLGFLWCPEDDLVSFFWRRSTLDMLPEACIISVPQDTYAFAHILCAAEENPVLAEPNDPPRIPEFTLRMTRHANGRGDAFADSQVRVPKEGEANANAKKLGTVSYGGKSVPLWLIRVPLKSGMIQDILREDETKYCFAYPLPTPRYLDIEIMEPLNGIDESEAFPVDIQSIRKRSYAPPTRRSSVHVFAVTLEASPAELIVKPSTQVNAFYAAENPALNAEVLPKEPGKYEISWDFADVDGKLAASGKKEISCSAGKNELVPIPVSVPNGWYASRVRLKDAAGRELVDHRGSFVMLPPDTRKAGNESPYGTWWFNWAHGGNKDVEHVGMMMQRLGLRHTMSPPDGMDKYKVTTWCVPWKQPGAASVESWVGDLEKHIGDYLKKYPTATTVMLYHESDNYGGRFPSEIWGEEPAALNEKSENAWQFRMKHMIPGMKMIREKFPQLKIQIGNAGDGCAMVAEMFRHGLPKDYVDYVAVEDLGQTIIPEKPMVGGLQSAWFLRETARKFGSNAQITACYEWISRMHMKLGLRTQAEWYIRDALHARAYGFHTISMSGIHDAGQGYFHSMWGNGGYCFRYPYMYPKPIYAAMAAHTQILDCAKFERMFPTGSVSLYAMEFQREGQWIYAVWVPRGNREAKFNFASDADITMTDLYGREKSVKGREINVLATTGPQYLSSKTKLASVTLGKTSFPEDAPPAKLTSIEKMESLAAWNVDGWESYKRLKGEFPFRVPAQGKYEIREVNDSEKGKCIEVELKPEGKLFPMIYEHTWLKLKEPKPLPGPYEYVGVWVKGNSSWGEIIAEVAGADGKTKMIQPDWPSTTNINFDGWNFIRLKIPAEANWKGQVSLTGLLITIPRQTLYGTEFVPVPELKIRLKDASFF